VDEDQARRCIDLALETFGSVDILVNNAGTNPAYGPMIEQGHDRFAKTFDVNLWAPLLWSGLATEAWMGEHGWFGQLGVGFSGPLRFERIGLGQSNLTYPVRDAGEAQIMAALAPTDVPVPQILGVAQDPEIADVTLKEFSEEGARQRFWPAARGRSHA
jgi:Enoyl-(Acyl carrier protein) reductase